LSNKTFCWRESTIYSITATETWLWQLFLSPTAEKLPQAVWFWLAVWAAECADSLTHNLSIVSDDTKGNVVSRGNEWGLDVVSPGQSMSPLSDGGESRVA
jgi:hypothetical protein